MNKDIKMDKILRYVCIGLGVLLIVAIFIPYIQLTGTAAKYSVDITLSNGKVLDGEAMKHLSIFDYIQVFIAGKDDLEQIGESYGTAYWAVYLVLYIASAAVFALTGLLSILGKRVGSIVFSIISILLNRVIYWDFEDLGIVGDYSRSYSNVSTKDLEEISGEAYTNSLIENILRRYLLTTGLLYRGIKNVQSRYNDCQ